jgi:hypothetical protein
MTNEHLASELGALVEAQLDGRATPEEQQRLEELVCASEEARAIYLEYVRDCVLLAAVARDAGLGQATGQGPRAGTGPSAAIDCPAPAPLAPPPAPDGLNDAPRANFLANFWPNERWLDAMPVVMFAVLMLAVGAFVGWRMGLRRNVEPLAPEQPVAQRPERAAGPGVQEKEVPPVPLPAHAATLVAAVNCEWIEATSDFHPGAAVAEGTELRLASGVAEIMFRSGVRVTLEGPAVLSAISTGGGALESGNLAAEVPPDAVGFAVRTPSATVIDLGTSFGVTVEPARVTEVHVIEGRVAIESFASARRRVIDQGHAWRLPSRDPQSWVEIGAVPERFYRTATTRFSAGPPAAEVPPSEPRPQLPAADAAALPAIDGAVRWLTLARDTFDGPELDDRRWEIMNGPTLVGRNPEVRAKNGRVELINCGLLVTRASFAATADKPLRTTAVWEVCNAMDKPTIAVDAAPDKGGSGVGMSRIIQCTFGVINPQTREPSLAILFGYPGQKQMEVAFAPCPKPESGARYRLDVVRYVKRVTFHVMRLDGDGWSRRVASDVPAGFVPAPERRVAVANFDLETPHDETSRVDEITVSTWETPGGQ